MKKQLPCLTTLMLLASCALAAPLPPLGPYTITGTVTNVQRHPARTILGIPGMSGSAGFTRRKPATTIVTLTQVEGVSGRQMKWLTGYVEGNWGVLSDIYDQYDRRTAVQTEVSRSRTVVDATATEYPTTVKLRLPDRRSWFARMFSKQNLTVGTRIRVESYEIAGDEGGIWSSYKTLSTIDKDTEAANQPSEGTR